MENVEEIKIRRRPCGEQDGKYVVARPFVKWVGGKSQLLSTLDSMLPIGFRDIPNVTYIEPFVGGGAMLFHMLQKYPNIRRTVVNDLNTGLTRAYRTVRDFPEELVDELGRIKREYEQIADEEARKNFYLSVRKHYNEDDLSDIECTVCLIFLNKTCFNGLYRVNSQGKFNVPFGRYVHPSIFDEKVIFADSRLLQGVNILNGDFEDTERYVTENTLVYFDPPYRPLDATSSFNSYAKEVFDDNEQRRLRRFYDRLSARGCLLMLSNSDCKGRNSEDTFFDDLYADYNIRRVWASRCVNANPAKRGVLTELLIRNYKNENMFNYGESAYRRTV